MIDPQARKKIRAENGAPTQGRHAISFASHINTYMRAMAARLSGKSSRGLENLAKAGEKGTCSRKELLRTL